MKNTGIRVTCAGTVSVLTTSQNITFFPGKRRFANAYPAMESKRRWNAVITPAITTVLNSHRTIGVVSKSRTKFAVVSTRGTISGGTRTTYCVGDSDVRNSQYNGKSDSPPARSRTTWTGRRCLILDIGPKRAELQHSDNERHSEQDHRHGTREPVAPELERCGVDELHDRDRRVVRPAAVRHDVHALEQLEREDRVDHEQVKRCRPQKRHRDVAPLREPARAVEVRRLVELPRERP